MLMQTVPRGVPSSNQKLIVLHARCQWYSPTCHKHCRILKNGRARRNCPYKEDAKNAG